MKIKWTDTPSAHKIITVVSILVNLAVVVFAVLQILELWTNAVDLCVPLLGVSMLCQAYLQWNTGRKTAWFCLGCSVLILICAIIVFFL